MTPTFKIWAIRSRSAIRRLRMRVRSMPQVLRVPVLLSISLSILAACVPEIGGVVLPGSDDKGWIPCSSLPPIIWAPGEVDEQLTGDALEQSRQAAIDHITKVITGADRSNPVWRAQALALVREIAGDPSDVAGQIKLTNVVIDDRCPASPQAVVNAPAPDVKPAATP